MCSIFSAADDIQNVRRSDESSLILFRIISLDKNFLTYRAALLV
jgi:hypothetical protein